MNIHRICLRILTFSTLLVGLTMAAQAQATRTWVSGVGDDVNPCSRTAPCKTFAGAISKTFINGEIDCLDQGGFGTITITKSITIDCSGTFGSILASGTTGVIVNIAAGNLNDPLRTVRLRGLSINGTGASGTVGTNTGVKGIRIIDAAKVVVEHVLIEGFSQNGISVESNSDIKVAVSNSSIRNNTVSGITGTSSAAIYDVLLSNCLISGNGIGVSSGRNTTMRISGNSIFGNTTGISPGRFGAIISFQNNSIDGNGTNGIPTSTVALQ